MIKTQLLHCFTLKKVQFQLCNHNIDQKGNIADNMDFNIKMAIIRHKIADITVQQYCMYYQFCLDKTNRATINGSKSQLKNLFRYKF